ncbi:hypothetical protein LEP1GSC020_4236 [Leptospira interrogans serovar Grippotyphosa str. 2006006986]|uniref:Uncharacterized protein n=1 Tax=Leptospira interrogans str. UI 12758 TaxID=1049938 RepID=A0A0E2DJT2_LEPIR|nr:hypothetical protein [Leptospira interrogans]EKO89671.1 hypothetical protein LEP1GSC009_1248 [Leptospira interrogans serovar Grippotyphosa str. Andaman]EKP84769.1 hypothetical protein LEP1GSC020_4236 [Leptospira interrogans serovar Grippotyphosa str. 2006006986]EKR55902.1 hypothetical protein LEP1GSC105_2145 [Leptospira interrogans str. UI 12758]QOI36499.1 hypothetical protein LeptoLang_20085 [Leptospira interrogans serovar Icterohaemorrhagiae]
MNILTVRVFHTNWRYFNKKEIETEALLHWYPDLQQFRSNICSDVLGFDEPIVFFAEPRDLSRDSPGYTGY